jgi:hypothetical protein
VGRKGSSETTGWAASPPEGPCGFARVAVQVLSRELQRPLCSGILREVYAVRGACNPSIALWEAEAGGSQSGPCLRNPPRKMKERKEMKTCILSVKSCPQKFACYAPSSAGPFSLEPYLRNP